MNWDAIGAVGEMAAAFAVIASLLFVGYQLRQSGAIERANAQRDLLKQAADWMSLASSDPLLFEAVRECLNEFESAEPIVKERFNGWAWKLLFLMEQVVYMNQDNFVNEGSFIRFEQAMLSMVSTRGGRQWWSLAYKIVGTDVGEHIQMRLIETKDSIPPWTELMPQLNIRHGAD